MIVKMTGRCFVLLATKKKMEQVMMKMNKKTKKKGHPLKKKMK
tara:strand:- start:275 stop:403 length:129 start_codon:yes stop_codon:yes gene_type:complete